jgi:hypothetical protein
METVGIVTHERTAMSGGMKSPTKVEKPENNMEMYTVRNSSFSSQLYLRRINYFSAPILRNIRREPHVVYI